jgi:hypothetical protein
MHTQRQYNVWIFSLKGLSVLALLILPSLLVLSQIADDTLSFFIKGEKKHTMSVQYIQYVNSQIYLLYVITYFQYSALIVILILYPFFSFVYSSETYFRKRGYESTVIEYERIKKIIYLLLPFSILYIYTIFWEKLPQIFYQNIYVVPVQYLLLAATLVVASALLKTIVQISKKDFRFYFAKACIKLACKREDEVEKMKCLIKCLKGYDKYLSREFRLQLNVSKIYTGIINSPMKERSELSHLVYQAFEGGKLDAVNYLSNHFKDNEDFISRNSLGNELQQLGNVLGWIISAILGIIGAVVTVLHFINK